MKVGIFAREGDPIATHLRARLEVRAVAATIFELGKIARGAPFAFDGDEWLFEGEALSDFDAFFVRQVPAETALLGQPGATATAEAWFSRALLARERAHLAQSCLRDLEASGKTVLNPSASANWDPKPLQLAALRRAGIRIPRTVITNFPAAVLALERDVGALVYKPIGGGAEAKLLDAAAKASLEQLCASGAIFQERVVGPDVRATVVGDRVVSCVEIPTGELDYRSSAAYRAGAQEYRPHALPADVERVCLHAARTCGQRLSGVDLKLTADGYVVIEANSGPVYLDIEQKTGAPITDAIAELLLAR